MTRYVVSVAWGEGAMVTRTVEFDRGRIVRAWDNDEQELVLARPFHEAVEAVLRAHEGSGHRGTPVRIEVEADV